MHFVPLDIVLPERLEGARAHVQRHERAAHAARLELGEHGGIEVQARRGRGDGARLTRIDGLIAFPIRLLGRAVDVGRKRHLAERLEEFEHIGRELQAEQVAVAVDQARAASSGQKHRGPRLERFARARVNQRRARREHPLEQQLDPAAAFLRAANPRRHDAGVVEHQEVVRAQQPRKIAEIEVAPQPARAVERQHPAAAARLGGPLRNQLGGKLEVKILALHPIHTTKRGNRSRKMER